LPKGLTPFAVAALMDIVSLCFVTLFGVAFMWTLAMIPVWRKTRELKEEVISSRDSQNWTLDNIQKLRKQKRSISAKSTFISK
jgi:hypothetical protein